MRPEQSSEDFMLPSIEDALASKRQVALQDILKLMDCHHERNSYCDHVQAVQVMSEVYVETIKRLLTAAVLDLPMPVHLKDVLRIFEALTPLVATGKPTGEKR